MPHPLDSNGRSDAFQPVWVSRGGEVVNVRLWLVSPDL
jgi:hypothetical protein